MLYNLYFVETIERMSSHSREDESTTSTNLKFTMKVMTKQFECFGNLFQQNNERFPRFMKEIERRQPPATFRGNARRNVRRNIKNEYKGVMGGEFEDEDPNVFVNYRGHDRRNLRRNEEKVDGNMGSIKMHIPQF